MSSFTPEPISDERGSGATIRQQPRLEMNSASFLRGKHLRAGPAELRGEAQSEHSPSKLEFSCSAF